jgi:RNA polymerase sigma factor (TIGR02999 family)
VADPLAAAVAAEAVHGVEGPAAGVSGRARKEREMEEQVTWDDVPQLMDEIRARARSVLKGDPHASLQTTEVMTSAVRRLKLTMGEKGGQATWENRDHFLATLYDVMKSVLRDHAKNRLAQKRDVRCTDPLDAVRRNPCLAVAERPENVLALFEVLKQLERQKPEWADVIQKRLLGWTCNEIARGRRVSTSTISRQWIQARHWCQQQFGGTP